MLKTCFFLLFFGFSLISHESNAVVHLPIHPEFSGDHRQALFATVQPTALRKLLAFASLYPETEEGKKALQQAWAIISPDQPTASASLPPDFEKIALSLLHLVESSPMDSPILSDEALSLIEKAGRNLPHRSLHGHLATTLDEVEKIDPQEIDLARALALLEHHNLPAKLTAVEASLDLLALEIIARVGPNADSLAKIAALNTLVFYDLGIRFPPQNESTAQSNQFSELSSVLSSRRGVCLGTTVVYLALAQRVGLPLTIYTPPGHIFVGYQESNRVRVIETTARGIDVPLDYYMGLTLRRVPVRSIKEVIGMVLFNQAAGVLKAEKWDEAYAIYKQASRFEHGEELQQMMSLCELLCGDKAQSKKRAKEQLSVPPKERLERDILLLDLADGSLSQESAKLIFKYSSAEGEEVLSAIKALQKAQDCCPQSRIIPFHLADLWLTYGKPKEAISLLESLSKRYDLPCSVHTITASLHLQRLNVKEAWKEALIALQKAKKEHFVPKQLKEFLLELQLQSPQQCMIE